jgi:hypothetical protein
MSKTFLNKQQKKYLKESGWETIPSTDGVIWFGQDWDSTKNSLTVLSELFPELLDASDESIIGYDLMVVGIRPERGE